MVDISPLNGLIYNPEKISDTFVAGVTAVSITFPPFSRTIEKGVSEAVPLKA